MFFYKLCDPFDPLVDLISLSLFFTKSRVELDLAYEIIRNLPTTCSFGLSSFILFTGFLTDRLGTNIAR
jgi:hypothetical protein